jgi:hypothetical protein
MRFDLRSDVELRARSAPSFLDDARPAPADPRPAEAVVVMKTLRAMAWVVFVASVAGCGSDDDVATPGGGGSSPTPEGGQGATESGATPGDDGAADDAATGTDATLPADDGDDGGGPRADAGDAGAGVHDSGPTPDGAGAGCQGPSDCTAVSSYCGSCRCLALGAGQSPPPCDAGTVSCLTDPCNGHSGVCSGAGVCSIAPSVAGH